MACKDNIPEPFDYDDDILPEARIFERRADNIMKLESEAYENLFKKNSEEQTVETDKNEENEFFAEIKEKLKRKGRGKNGKSQAKPKIDKKTVVSAKVPRRNSRRGKNQASENTMEIDGDITTTIIDSPVNLPADSKRRLKELHLKTSRDKERVDEECRRILMTCDSVSLPLIEPEAEESVARSSEQNINIRYMSKISKIKVSNDEKFGTIIPKVADLLHLKASEILLCIEDRNITLTDTPLGLRLRFYDVIDCLPYKPQAKESEVNTNEILIKFQSSDSRKRIEMYSHKLEKFKDVLERYAKLRSLPIKDLIFEFDGEKIDGSETPEDLDMESGSCIDVKVLNLPVKGTKAHIIPVVDIYEKIPDDQILDVCEID